MCQSQECVAVFCSTLEEQSVLLLAKIKGLKSSSSIKVKLKTRIYSFNPLNNVTNDLAVNCHLNW